MMHFMEKDELVYQHDIRNENGLYIYLPGTNQDSHIVNAQLILLRPWPHRQNYDQCT